MRKPEELIATWRERARQNRADRDAETVKGTPEYDAGTIAAEVCEACADELEAALAAPPQTPQQELREAVHVLLRQERCQRATYATDVGLATAVDRVRVALERVEAAEAAHAAK